MIMKSKDSVEAIFFVSVKNDALMGPFDFGNMDCLGR